MLTQLKLPPPSSVLFFIVKCTMLFILLVPPLILPLIIIFETENSPIFYKRYCPPPADVTKVVAHLLLTALPDTRLSSLLALPWLLWLTLSSSR